MNGFCAISLGSNDGNSKEILSKVIELFKKDKIFRVEKVSSLYFTEPVETFPQPYFYNIVAIGNSFFDPFETLKYFLSLENVFGRVRSKRKGKRTLDIDLLFYKESIIKTDVLTLPHPSLLSRKCVLIPLKEISPRWKHPQTGSTIDQLLSRLNGAQKVIKLQETIFS